MVCGRFIRNYHKICFAYIWWKSVTVRESLFLSTCQHCLQGFLWTAYLNKLFLPRTLVCRKLICIIYAKNPVIHFLYINLTKQRMIFNNYWNYWGSQPGFNVSFVRDIFHTLLNCMNYKIGWIYSWIFSQYFLNIFSS